MGNQPARLNVVATSEGIMLVNALKHTKAKAWLQNFKQIGGTFFVNHLFPDKRRVQRLCLECRVLVAACEVVQNDICRVAYGHDHGSSNLNLLTLRPA